MSTNEKHNVLREEALARLEILRDKGLESSVVRDFKGSNTLYYSERARLGNLLMGVLYWVNNEEKFAKAVRDFEEKYNAVVYHATHEYTEFGELLDLFYVANEPECWECDHQDLRDGYASCYVVNFDEPDFCEFGSISFTLSGGGAVRLG